MSEKKATQADKMKGYKIIYRLTALDGTIFYPGDVVIVSEDYGSTCVATVRPQAPDDRAGTYTFMTDELRGAFP